MMTSMGEKMSEQEVEDMIKEAAPNGDGRVNYEGEVAAMTCDLFSGDPKTDSAYQSLFVMQDDTTYDLIIAIVLFVYPLYNNFLHDCVL